MSGAGDLQARKRIRELAALMSEHGLSELEVRSGDEAIRLVRPLAGHGEPVLSARPVGEEAGDAGVGGGLASVVAPMAGTFYVAPEPGAEPFVREGQRVSAGDVVGIIESMKMMNEIRTDVGGVCVGVAAADGAPVASGDVLFRIAP
ncbi:MAG: acetyl-CoA carboxylase biotin carboxyl carrier protein [Pseudomonadota bacterium]